MRTRGDASTSHTTDVSNQMISRIISKPAGRYVSMGQRKRFSLSLPATFFETPTIIVVTYEIPSETNSLL